MKLEAHGIRAELPSGWEGGIRSERRDEVEASVRMFSAEDDTGASPDTAPVAHFATFALPVERDDFGGDLLELMDDDDLFVALLEYGPAEVGTALFEAEGLPRKLDPGRFSPGALQRSLAGRLGFQRFFTEGGRPFCLYVVIRDGDPHRQVRRVEQLLERLEITPR